ncbi:thioredoxin [Polytolypa hystricis UAMH7299]|uniref:Thioredoxin n=1 Tax=Polytolypa hystricis (strain UAMH7299) TaxID=1447883 RepID=A0A2B7Z223_POLH7|nr:thioredoxin [Polytolypa hystricis UAMH7299]
MSKTVSITSKEQFDKLLTSSAIVVTDFFADWCQPCKVIAPTFEELSSKLSRPDKVTFTKINVDSQNELAAAYNVTAMPTFMIFKNGTVADSIRGANPRALVDKVQAAAGEVDGNGGESSGASWIGGSVPKGYQDITDQIDIKGIDLLNCDNDIGPGRSLFEPSKPSSLSSEGGNNGKAKEQASADWVESDTDEQLMLYMPFQSALKIHSLQITSLPPASDDDEAPMRPKTLKLFTNRTHIMGFEDGDDEQPTQTFELAPQDWDAKTGTAKVELRFVKFQNINSLVVYFVDGDGDSEKIRVDRVRIFGESGEKRDMGKLEKIGDEPGE